MRAKEFARLYGSVSLKGTLGTNHGDVEQLLTGAQLSVNGVPPRETEPMRWDHWTMQADGGTGGRDVIEPGAWLLAYWMGRYYGFIEAPKVSDPSLLAVAGKSTGAFGARPYSGPARPEGF